MGVSTNAILFYGIDLMMDEEDEEYNPVPWGEDDDMDEWLDELLGKGHGLDIVIHCSYESSMYALAVKESITTARRGVPQSLGQTIAARGEWATIIHDAYEKMTLEHKHNNVAQWTLVSLWG